jgi:tRNA pseudouridine38-40 synthase
VHALGQVAHVDLGRQWAPERLMAALNHHLRPAPVAVLEVRETAPDFHARFSATRRRYVYRILNRRAPPVLERNRVWHLPVPLSAVRMHEAAQCLVGRHDFTSFRSSECQSASPVKTLSLVHVRQREDLIEIWLQARSFLHHQVRNIVGTLKLVGEGKAPIEHVRRVLEARDRAAAGQTAPAHGLFLVDVGYED